MDSAPRYYWRWIKTTFARPFLIADGIAGFISMAGGLAVYMEWIPAKALALAAIFISLGILVIGVVVQFIVAPYLLHREDQEETSKSDILRRLKELARQGQKLFDQPPRATSPADSYVVLDRWRSEYTEWLDITTEELRNLCTAQEVDQFWRIDESRNNISSQKCSLSDAKPLLAKLEQYLENLRKIITERQEKESATD